MEKDHVEQTVRDSKINGQLTRFIEDLEMESTEDDKYIIQYAKELKENR
jgi:hypothetical protein